jgi:hypothetical protein
VVKMQRSRIRDENGGVQPELSRLCQESAGDLNGASAAAVACKLDLPGSVAGAGERLHTAIRSAPISPLTLHVDTWNSELIDDSDREFIMDGVMNGFRLVDIGSEPLEADCDNCKSAASVSKDLVQEQIQVELDSGRYVITEVKPTVVSALGAIPKSSTKVRLIHDLSRPYGGVNQFASDTSVHYPTIDEATFLMKDYSFLAKIDLKEAYRSVPLHSSCYDYTGLKWNFDGSSTTYMFDARLPFGASRACKIFQSLTNSIVRMLAKRKITVIGYIDDFLIICDSYLECSEALQTVIHLVHSLGLQVNWSKVAGPTQCITFLGVEINCATRNLALPKDKLYELRKSVTTWLSKRKVTKKTVQHIVGKLNWCCKVMIGGRTFLRNIVNLLLKVEKSHHMFGLVLQLGVIWLGGVQLSMFFMAMHHFQLMCLCRVGLSQLMLVFLVVVDISMGIGFLLIG